MRKTIRRQYRKARAQALDLWHALTGYTIHAGGEWMATHYAGSFADALDWARAYPATCPVSISHRGRFLAAR